MLVEDSISVSCWKFPCKQSMATTNNDNDALSQYKGTSWTLMGPHHGILVICMESHLVDNCHHADGDNDDDSSEYVTMEED
mmetsp:Transcript_4488/g.10174  ORF Transcript_4488/g.10174 Transcript_4488/m.10174 type:complete len:81 (+) Transcript_4488:516-758(+)